MYWLKVIHRWFSYADMLLIVWVVSIWFLHLIYTIEGGILAVISVGTGSSKSGAFGLTMLVLGPFINLYVWYKWSVFFVEAEDDVYRAHKDPPTQKLRLKIIKLFSVVIGLIFFPIFIRFYTSNILILWPSEGSFWFAPGFYLALVTSTFGAVFIPMLFPKFSRSLKKIESIVDAMLEKNSRGK